MNDMPIVLIGTSDLARIAYDTLVDHDHQIAVVSDREEYLDDDQVFGCSTVPFEMLDKLYDPGHYRAFVAVAYRDGNRVREAFFTEAAEMGYGFQSIVSGRASAYPTASIGKNCYIFEENVIQPYVGVGDNVVMWSGNHVGHHSAIGAHTFVASHAVISGHCDIGERCFIGVNATIADGVTIGDDCLIGAGALVLDDVGPDTVIGAEPTPEKPYSAGEYWG